MKRWIVIATVLVAVAAALFVTRRNSLHAEQAPRTVTVIKGNVVQEALAIGSIVPEQEISVKSKVPGIISKVHVAVGDFVKAGDPLIDIRPDPTPIERTEAERAVQIARVAADGAKKDVDRAEELFSQGLLADKEVEIARRENETARLRYQLEQEKLQLLRDGHARLEGSEVSNRILSPATGTVLSCELHPGDPVVPLTSYQDGTVLMTMADMKDLIFRGTVDEVDVGKLSVGRAATFTVGAIPQAAVKGTLSRISPKARKQESTTLFDIEARIEDSGGQELRAGYSTNAKIVIAKAESVLVIPERVVKFENDQARVRIPGKDGKPVDREIKTGLSDGLNIEVKEGLAEKDLVLEPEPSPLARK